MIKNNIISRNDHLLFFDSNCHCERSEAISWAKKRFLLVHEIASPENHEVDFRDRNDLYGVGLMATIAIAYELSLFPHPTIAIVSLEAEKASISVRILRLILIG